MSLLPPDPVFCFKEDMGYIHSLSFWVRSKEFVSHILAATEKGTVYFWDLETNRLQHKQEMGKSIQTIHSVDFNIITQEKSGSINLWSVEGSSYEVIKNTECSSGYCKSIIVNQFLIVSKENGSVEILDVNSLAKINELEPDREALGHVMALEKVILDNKFFVMAGYETGWAWELGFVGLRTSGSMNGPFSVSKCLGTGKNNLGQLCGQAEGETARPLRPLAELSFSCILRCSENYQRIPSRPLRTKPSSAWLGRNQCRRKILPFKLQNHTASCKTLTGLLFSNIGKKQLPGGNGNEAPLPERTRQRFLPRAGSPAGDRPCGEDEVPGRED
ncbi:hypothetical protein JTB14_000834 [Gonioctena quinquepunctata]|nr:hypothetical protein JTB14_000834 [Gonioctena quinquepunctata]